MSTTRCGRLPRYAGVALTAILFGVSSPALTQNRAQGLPVVTAAPVPFYPRTARLAHIQGTVKVRVTTDGKRVRSVVVESGPPMLVRAAEENIRAWQFEVHKPTTFLTTFDYRLEEPGACKLDNGTIVLNMPSAVQITAKAVVTCDPSVTLLHIKNGSPYSPSATVADHLPAS